MKDLSLISSELFNKIRSRFQDIKLGDENGSVTTDPEQSRFFDLLFKIDGKTLGQVNIKLDDTTLTVIFSNGLTNQDDSTITNKWYDFLKELREFARSNLLKFDTRDITKSNLDKRDYQFLAQKTGESKMSESKLFGTSRTSYQDIGEAKLIIKHSQPINYNLPAGRTMHIESIYIESASGERFRYPYKHLNGARALAIHVANGGTAYDPIGGYISSLSEELGKLRQFKNYVNRSGLVAETLGDITPKVLDRIDTIKQEIFNLQKQNYYETFKESFEQTEATEVPEETVNQWVDALTIKTFNEELKSVFPYIYKLVDHVKPTLDYEDLVQEALMNKVSCSQCGQAFWSSGTDGFSSCKEHKGKTPTKENDNSDVEESTLFDEFVDRIESISQLDYQQEDQMGELNQDQSSSSITQEVLEFIEAMYDRERGTFPRGEEGVKIAVEKKFGEQAGKFADFVVEKLSCKLGDSIQEEPTTCESEVSADILDIKKLAGL